MNVIKTFITSNLSCCRSKSTKTSLLWVELWEKPPTCTDAKPSYWSRTQALIPCFWAWLGLHANTLSCLTWFDDIKERVENMVSHVCYKASVASARKKCKHSHISGKRTSNSDGSKSAQRRANMSHEFRHWNWPPTSDTRSWLCAWCHKSVWEVDRRRGEGISEKRKCGKPKANERTLRGKEEKDRKCKRRRRTGGKRLMQEGEKCVGCTPDANINVCVAGYNMSIQTGIYMTWIWRYFCLCGLHLWI